MHCCPVGGIRAGERWLRQWGEGDARVTKTVGRGARSSVVPGFSFVTGTVPDYYQILLRVVLHDYVPCGSSRFLDGSHSTLVDFQVFGPAQHCT